MSIRIVDDSHLLGNAKAHLQKTAQSGNKLWTGLEKEIITVAPYQGTPVGASGLGTEVRFRIDKRRAILASVTLKGTVAALATTNTGGGETIEYVDDLAFNIWNRNTGWAVYEGGSDNVIERRTPDEMYLLLQHAMDEDEIAYEYDNILGGMSTADRRTAAASAQTFYLNLAHYSDVLASKVPLNRTTNGFDIVFNIAPNHTDVINTDDSIASGVSWTAFELIVEYNKLTPEADAYISGYMNSAGGWPMRVRKFFLYQDTLSSGASQFQLTVNQLRNLGYCPWVPFVVRQQSDLTSSTAKTYENFIQISDNYSLEENGERIVKNQFTDSEFKGVYLHQTKPKNIQALRGMNMYYYAFTHDVARSLELHERPQGRGNFGGKRFYDTDQVLRVNFSSNLGSNHRIDVFPMIEQVKILRGDGRIY